MKSLILFSMAGTEPAALLTEHSSDIDVIQALNTVKAEMSMQAWSGVLSEIPEAVFLKHGLQIQPVQTVSHSNDFIPGHFAYSDYGLTKLTCSDCEHMNDGFCGHYYCSQNPYNDEAFDCNHFMPSGKVLTVQADNGTVAILAINADVSADQKSVLRTCCAEPQTDCAKALIHALNDCGQFPRLNSFLESYYRVNLSFDAAVNDIKFIIR